MTERPTLDEMVEAIARALYEKQTGLARAYTWAEFVRNEGGSPTRWHNYAQDAAEAANVLSLLSELAATEDELATARIGQQANAAMIDTLRADYSALMERSCAELAAYVPCDPCKQGRHATCTGDCSSNCCAAAAVEAERDALREALVTIGTECRFYFDHCWKHPGAEWCGGCVAAVALDKEGDGDG
jgi:hypothetical protein